MAKVVKRLKEGSKSIYIIEYRAYQNKTAATWKQNKQTIEKPVKVSARAKKER